MSFPHTNIKDRNKTFEYYEVSNRRKINLIVYQFHDVMLTAFSFDLLEVLFGAHLT